MIRNSLLAVIATLAGMAVAETVIDVTGSGAQKHEVAVRVANRAFATSLRRNLEMSGLFVVKESGGIVVSGTPGASVQATGGGKSVTQPAPGTDDASARMAARRLSDAMCEAYGGQKGFACDRIAFVNRKGSNSADLCTCYADGLDARKFPSDNAGIVGPRWKNANTLFYTSLAAGPQIWEYDVASERRPTMKWSFKGLTTGAAVSPDGSRVAIILSFQGNPELYVIDSKDNYVRLTNTKNASEGCPAWSPDGRQIVYMSNANNTQQLYIADVATRKSVRLTGIGRQNMEPDWGKDGRIAYVSNGQIKVIAPKEGESSAITVTKTGGWRHPSWSRDGRHLVASNGKTMYVIDTMPNGDDPRPIPLASGNWGDPCWSK